MDKLELIRDEDKKVLFIFNDYMNARSTLFKIGFSDSVHKTNDGFQRWQYNGMIFGLSHIRDGVYLGRG